MQLNDDLQLLMLVTVIVIKCTAAATASRHNIDSKLVEVGQGSDQVQNSADFQQHDDVDEATALQRPVFRADVEEIVDAGRPTEWENLSRRRRRRRRSLRPTKTVELAETSRGQLLTLGTDYAERFAFKDTAPHQLDISAVMGNVLLREGQRLDYETEPEVEFVVIVTRVDDVACEYIRIFLPW